MAHPASTEWRTYEEVAQYLLNAIADEFGLAKVEGKQKVLGSSGIDWEIDAKGVRQPGNDGFVIIECRRYTKSRLNQESIGGLAYRISDTRASGAIVVSPLELQAGAKNLADFEGVTHVTLSAESTTTEYMLRFLNKVFIGVSDIITMSASVSLTRTFPRAIADSLHTSDIAGLTLMSVFCSGGQHAKCTNSTCSCVCHRAAPNSTIGAV